MLNQLESLSNSVGLWTSMSERKFAEFTFHIDQDGFAARTVRGGKCADTDSLLNEFSAALQFPYYFGENWNAFDECISDLNWLSPGRGYVVLIPAADRLLENERDCMQFLVSSLIQAQNEFRQPISNGDHWDRPAIPFHVVLQIESPGQLLCWQEGENLTELHP